MIERPDTIEEMVHQLWFAIIGSNGDGLATEIRNTRKLVEKMQETQCADKEELEKIREDDKKKIWEAITDLKDMPAKLMKKVAIFVVSGVGIVVVAGFGSKIWAFIEKLLTP